MRLSICIATYNRAGVIGETLASILPQLREGVELLVVDGDSPDATESIVRACFGARTDCRYVRLPRKGGVDQDYCLAVEQAHGDYCWLMTDDDTLKPQALDRVLDALRTDPDLLVVNAEVAGPDLGATLLDRKLRIDVDREVGPGRADELLALAGDLLTFIGSVVIRRQTWLARDPAPYLGTEFIHVGMIFQRPLERHTLVIAAPLVRIRYGLAQWSRRAFEIWMFRWPRLIWSLPGFSDAARNTVCPREPWRLTARLVTMKAQGAYSRAEYRRWLEPLDMPALTRLRAAGLAALPRGLFATLMRLLVPLLPPHEQAMMTFELRRSSARPPRG
jgi:glycosyltransferase involved in cell wall biosynthesis